MELYEINKQLASILEMDGEYIDTDSGEMMTLEQVEALKMERAEKLEMWGLWLKNRAAEVAMIKAEIDSLTDRMKKVQAMAERSRERYMDYLDGEKVSTARLKVSYSRSKAVEFNGDVNLLPDSFKRTKTIVEPDKKALKEALAAGLDIAGARLVEKTSLVIK